MTTLECSHTAKQHRQHWTLPAKGLGMLSCIGCALVVIGMMGGITVGAYLMSSKATAVLGLKIFGGTSIGMVTIGGICTLPAVQNLHKKAQRYLEEADRKSCEALIAQQTRPEGNPVFKAALRRTIPSAPPPNEAERRTPVERVQEL